MMRRGTLMRLAAVVAVSIGTVGQVVAGPILILDANGLKRACSDHTLHYDYGRCTGYVIGAHDEHVLAVGWEVNICVPLEEGGTGDHLIAPVLAYLERNPRRLFDPASSVVIAALKEAFPCR
jgi:hypothetical protein